MDINYELYRVFYYVARDLSFSEASKKLFISQSAVSQSIKTLEKKLDQQLFIRSTKKVRLTPAGEVLYRHVEPAMNLIQRGEEQLSEGNIASAGQLHIAASDTICRYFLVPYIGQFHQQFPDVEIRVTNATSLDCVDLLRQGNADVILTNYPNVQMPSSAIIKTVCEFHDVFCGNPKSFHIRGILSLEQIAQFSLMMLPKHSTTSEFLYKIFLSHQLELLPTIRLSSNDLLMDLAKIGLGIAFVPDLCMKQDTEDLINIRLNEALPPRQIVVAASPSVPLSGPAEAFLDLLPEV